MTPWLSIALTLIQLIASFVKWKERDTIISEIEQVERAKALLAAKRTLDEAAQLSAEVAKLNDEELASLAEKRGWFRD